MHEDPWYIDGQQATVPLGNIPQVQTTTVAAIFLLPANEVWGKFWAEQALGGACSGGCAWFQGVPAPGGCMVEGTWWRPPHGYCCGQYASYWNAFLL